MLIKLLISGLFESTVSLVVGHVLHIKCYLNDTYVTVEPNSSLMRLEYRQQG